MEDSFNWHIRYDVLISDRVFAAKIKKEKEKEKEKRGTKQKEEKKNKGKKERRKKGRERLGNKGSHACVFSCTTDFYPMS